MRCEAHPSIELPHMLTCPLCAQEARTAAYAIQRAKMERLMARAAQAAPDPASEGEP